ncbi:flavoprotein [Streptomyces sp. TP-A0874]|uniref:flavoprotein n=1 Tax=Streptomyces sp. TP-A0874 TaxID=549819 RepID=UPI000853B5E0|nr:flavoprotein [Streptomyces sp. TP-A0874]
MTPRRLPEISLRRKRVLLVASGSISVTALPQWATLLRAHYGWSVRVCLTHSAEQLVSRNALAAVSGAPVEGPEWGAARGVVPHQELAEWPDLVIVAPAGLNFVAKCAAGMADGLALTTVITTTAPVLIAPSLPETAAGRPSVQRNLKLLEEDGYHVVAMEAVYSVHRQAMSPTGMPQLSSILKRAQQVLSEQRANGPAGS